MIPLSDAQLVAAVAAVDTELAARLRARLQLLRLAGALTRPPPHPVLLAFVRRANARLIRHDLIQ